MNKLFFLIIPFFLLSCGSTSEQSSSIINEEGNISAPIDQPLDEQNEQQSDLKDPYENIPYPNPCKKDEFYRIKTKECIALQHPDWGFQDFNVSEANIYYMQSCEESELEELLANIPAEGGKIVMKECTIETNDGIVINDNTILEGAGMGKTILSNHKSSAVKIEGKNVILRGFTVEGNHDSLNGISAYGMKGNVLVEYIEARNFKIDQGSGISFLTKGYLASPRVTVRFCLSYGQLHGIVGKSFYSRARMLIYSNEAYNNYNYGLDFSQTADAEIAGNYFHHNRVAGAKSPSAHNVTYRYNDINYNGASDSTDGKAGVVYAGYSYFYYSFITLEHNDLSNNGGQAFACWNATIYKVTLRDNIVTGSQDSNGYNIGVDGVKKVEVYGDHGRIWAGDGNQTEIIYH